MQEAQPIGVAGARNDFQGVECGLVLHSGVCTALIDPTAWNA